MAPTGKHHSLTLQMDATSSIKQRTRINELFESNTEDELKKIEYEDGLIEYRFFHDIINDRIDNNYDRLGFSGLEIEKEYVSCRCPISGEKKRIGDFSPNPTDMTYQYPGGVPPTAW